jgi:hypothetical protein
MNGGKNIVKWIKGQRISWLGHLERMEEDRMPKKIFTQELEGTRRRGRPRKRWKEEVERDLQVLGVKRWRELVTDREKWRDIFRQAKAHSGLWCQWRRRRMGWTCNTNGDSRNYPTELLQNHSQKTVTSKARRKPY